MPQLMKKRKTELVERHGCPTLLDELVDLAQKSESGKDEQLLAEWRQLEPASHTARAQALRIEQIQQHRYLEAVVNEGEQCY